MTNLKYILGTALLALSVSAAKAQAVAVQMYADGPTFTGAKVTTAVGAAITAQATVAPAYGVVHVIASTAAIATITPPAGCTTNGYACRVILIPDVAFTTATGGNIALASTAVQYRPLVMTYDAAQTKWYPSY